MISYVYTYFFSEVFKHITVINYFTFHDFPGGKQRQVLSPHFTDKVTDYQMASP